MQKKSIDFDFTSSTFNEDLWIDFKKSISISKIEQVIKIDPSSTKHKIQRLYFELWSFLSREKFNFKKQKNLSKLNKLKQQEYLEISTLNHLLKVLSRYTDGFEDFLNQLPFELNSGQFTFDPGPMYLNWDSQLKDLIKTKLKEHDKLKSLDSLSFSSSLSSMYLYLNAFQQFSCFQELYKIKLSANAKEIKERMETIKNLNTYVIDLFKNKILMHDYFSNKEVFILAFSLFYEPLKKFSLIEIEDKTQGLTFKKDDEVLEPQVEKKITASQSISESLGKQDSQLEPELSLEIKVKEPLSIPFQENEEKENSDEPDNLDLELKQTDSSFNEELNIVNETEMENWEKDFRAELEIYNRFKVQKTLLPTEQQKTIRNKQEKEWLKFINSTFTHEKQKTSLRALFDDKTRPQMSFDEITGLIKRVGGDIRYQGRGSSHFRFILPKGVIGFSWRPHGEQTEKRFEWYQLEAYRQAFKTLGIDKVLVSKEHV